jgi:coenzyme F420-0:L-glutamate ligase / coenzyme F420-1:gamma-L-glutamate ligase
MPTFTAEQIAFLAAQRVGRLATADSARQPHVVPVCYAFDSARIFIALDAKPKRVAPERLKRVRNILANPQVALVVDRYSEDWSQLAFLLVQGSGEIVTPGTPEHTRAIALLRDRYPQYRAMPIDSNPVIAIRPASIVIWPYSDLGHGHAN